jgi:hypothetical protein
MVRWPQPNCKTATPLSRVLRETNLTISGLRFPQLCSSLYRAAALIKEIGAAVSSLGLAFNSIGESHQQHGREPFLPTSLGNDFGPGRPPPVVMDHLAPGELSISSFHTYPRCGEYAYTSSS